MHFNTKSFAILGFIFVTSISFAQYKYDIGLRASSFDLEQIQLEQRFHFDSPYSLVITLGTGTRNLYNSTRSPLYDGNYFDEITRYSQARNNSLKVGIQRKLGFLASDFFYAGAAVGIGLEEQKNLYARGTFVIPDSDTANYQSVYYNPYDQLVSSTSIRDYSKAFHTQLALSFGMDVPLTKRISVNAEISTSAIFSQVLTYNYSSFTVRQQVSGGLRYQFGIRN